MIPMNPSDPMHWTLALPEVVLAIVGFVLYRLRAFRRETAESAVPSQSPSPERSGRHRQS